MNEQEYRMFDQPEGRPPAPKKSRKGLGFAAIMLCIAFVCGVAGYAIGSERRTPELVAPTATNQLAGRTDGTQNAGGSFSFEKMPSAFNTESSASDVTEIAEKNLDAVVLVTSMVPAGNYGFGFDGGDSFPFGDGRQQYSESRGSGFFISADGYIVTNNHVVAGAESVSVTLNNEQVLDAQVVGTDEKTDIAVLKVAGSGYAYSTFGDSSLLRVGELCVAIGNPLGTLTGTVTSGVIGALERTITVENMEMSLLQHNAAINSGNSGGPLYNARGEVVGINNAKTAALGVEGLNFAIPSNTAKPVIEDLINFGYVTGRPYIGISVQAITEMQAEYYNVVAGLGVVNVAGGSPAEQAGLLYGDIITAANGQEIRSADDLNTVKNGLKVGDSLSVTVWREGATLTLNITLGEDIPQTVTPTSNRTRMPDAA